ncbi:MAG: hypothetical protein MUF27_07205 [Acidobacteria bacterium]|jgi:hypothetical protein|nr:hypothetical protein [Acidobacteriota bacterium]
MEAFSPAGPRRAAFAAALVAAVALAFGAPEVVRRSFEPPAGTPDPTPAGLSARARAALPPGLPDAEKAHALARWVVAHATNDPRRKSPGEPLPLHGLCGTRSAHFVALARAAGLRAERVNLYDFPRPGAGHSCAQVFWNGGWHFFDVTYAGVFARDGEVLSLEGIRADPAGAVAGMAVFEGGLDRDADGRPVDNRERMRAVWTAEAIRRIGAAGVPGNAEPVPLTVRWDLARGPRALAAADPAGLDRRGAAAGITHQLGSLLGAGPQRFAPRLELDGVEPGEALALRLSFARANRAGIALAAAAEGATLERGANLVTTAAMTAPGRHDWTIVVRPRGPRFVLTLAPPPAGGRIDLISAEWLAPR